MLGTIAFLGGVILFVTCWRVYFRFQKVGLWLMKAEHELTHLIFAALTGHPIVGVTRELNRGSHVQFVGSGNWLITIAPYFFPTAAIVFWFIAVLVPFGTVFYLTNFALGFATGFHVVSTIREIRRDQAELVELSWRFCWYFLPSANLLILGLLLSFSQTGLTGMAQFVSDSFSPIWWIVDTIRAFLPTSEAT